MADSKCTCSVHNCNCHLVEEGYLTQEELDLHNKEEKEKADKIS